MRLTWISEYEAREGRLIEWTLDRVTLAAAAAAPADPRPASFMQEAHVQTALALRGAGVRAPTWLGTAFDVPGVLDRRALEAALLAWIARHETLRSGLRLVDGELERFTLSTDAVALAQSVAVDFGAGADVLSYLDARFDEATDPLTWPPYLFVTVAREDAFTVYLAFDHSNVDGYSIVQIPHEIHELYAAARDGHPAALSSVGSYVDFSTTERERARHVDETHDAVVRWRELVADCDGQLPAFALDHHVTPGELPKQTGVCEWLLDVHDAKAFAAACKAAGANAHAGVLAIASIIARQRAAQPVYRTIIPLHTRTEQRWATSLGWYVALAPIQIDSTQARDFQDLITIAHDELTTAKKTADVPFAKVCDLLHTALRPTSVLSYMDGRMVPGAHQWATWNARGFGKVSYGDETYLWINRTVNGLYATARYPGTPQAHTNITTYLNDTRHILHTIATTGTYPLTNHHHQIAA
jgi:hypothetical protein